MRTAVAGARGPGPEEYRKWMAYGFSVAEAREWIRDGVDPEDALVWREAGVEDARDALRWRVRGFGAAEAASVIRLGRRARRRTMSASRLR